MTGRPNYKLVLVSGPVPSSWQFEKDRLKFLIMNCRASVVKPDAIMLVINKWQMRVSKVAVPSCGPPIGKDRIEIAGDTLNGAGTREMPLVYSPRNSQPIDPFISHRLSIAPSTVARPTSAIAL